MSDQIQGIFFKDFKNSYIPHILKEIYIDKIYEPYFFNKTDLTVLDVGANVGLFSYFAYPASRKIYAIEPSGVHLETLNYMIKFNSMEDKIEPVKIALSNKDGEATFYHHENRTMYSLRPEVNQKPEESETVQTSTLKSFLTKYKIENVDFMKLDVEGSECELVGSKGFEESVDKVKVIMGEYHQWASVNPNQFMTYLLDYGYRFEWLKGTDASIFIAEK